jgi:hypothetical protein
MDEPRPRRPIFSIPTKMFLLGLALGYWFAALGEQVTFSKGTLFGAAFGGIIGGFIGMVVSPRKRK